MEKFILVEYIRDFMKSKERKRMLEGDKYYKGETNEKLFHGFMNNMVEEKVQYLLGKPYTIKCNDEKCGPLIQEVLGDDFDYNLQGVAIEASNKGIAWLQCYIDDKGIFKTMPIPSEQVCPIWHDATHKELDSLLRIYEQETYTGTRKEMVTHVEHYENDGVTYYLLEHDNLVLDAEKYLNVPDNVAKCGHFTLNAEHMTFNTIPFIWFKNNRYEIHDLQMVKTLIDDYNEKRGEVSDLLTECKNFIYSIRNYGGDLDDDILASIKEKRRIFVDDDGGVDVITPKIDIQAAQEHYKQLKEDIQLFGKSVPRQKMELGNSPSGVALKFMYSGLDLKCNGLEAELKYGFRRLLKLVNIYLSLFKQQIEEDAEILFNRDITINETESITQAQQSLGVISKRTIIANHPWVSDLEEEMAQLEAEEPTLDDYSGLGGGAGEE